MYLVKKKLGSTNIYLSPIGLGTVKFGRNTDVKYPESFNLPTDQEILSLLSCCEEYGINLLDTAPAYGNSEERIGKLLGNKRKNFIISTKVGEIYTENKSRFDFSSRATQSSLENSLRRLKTDYLDIVLVHSNGDDENIILNTDVFEILKKMKEKGLIRAIGMSTKTVAGGKLAVKLSDVVMTTYNKAFINEEPVLIEACKEKKGVLIKKALLSGHLPRDKNNYLRSTMKFIFSQPVVSSVVVGTLNVNHLRQNVLAARDADLTLANR